MADPAQEAAKEAAKKVSPFTDFIRGIPGHMWKGALDPSHFIPPSIMDVMQKSPTASFVGKSIGEAFGMDYGAGRSAAHIGEAKGFLGLKNWVDVVETARTPGSVGVIGKTLGAAASTVLSGVSAYWTYDSMSSGYQENGIVGAGAGLAQSTLTGMMGRKLALPPIVGAGAQAWAAAEWGGAAIAGSKYIQGAGFLGGAARFLGGTAGFIGGGAAGAFFSPLGLMIAAGVYGYGQLEEYSRKNDQAIARNKQIGGLELVAQIR